MYGVDVAASYDNQDTRDVQTGSFLPYRPANFGSLTISKKQEWWDLGGQMQVSGSQQSNPGNANPANNDITMGGYTLFNIFGSVNLIKDVSLFIRGNNIFNRQYSTNASGYAASTRGSILIQQLPTIIVARAQTSLLVCALILGNIAA